MLTRNPVLSIDLKAPLIYEICGLNDLSDVISCALTCADGVLGADCSLLHLSIAHGENE